MLSFYPSAAHTHSYQPRYSARSTYSDDVVRLHPSISAYSSLPRTTHPESRYRRALAEYLAAEEELLRARQEATLRARAEVLRRQEEARLLQARTIRAREEQQVRRLKQLLAQRCAAALAAKTATPEVPLSLTHGVPVVCSVPERRRKPISSVFTPKTHLSFMGENQLFDFIPVKEEDRPEHQSASDLVPENGASASTLESLLQARLRKVARENEDKEVQDLARATLQHLVQPTPDKNDTSALSSETTLDSVTPLPQGTDLSRSDALQGTAAEAAKASFKAHREAVAEQVSKDAAAPLEAIQDIRATLSKLSADFSIPPSLDFSNDEVDGLAYTPTNAPIRVYEHALEGLLAQLDAVESDGDEEVRVARRSAVKEVETALEGVESEVKRAREVAKDNSKHGGNLLAETTASPSDLVEEGDTHTCAESEFGTKTKEDSASIPSRTPAASYSSLAPVSATEVDPASFTADFVDVVPDNSAIEDTSAEESTEVVTEPTSSTSPATVQDEVARIYIGEVPASMYNTIAESEHEASVSPTSETREEVVSVPHEGFIFTSTPVSPALSSSTLPDDVSASGMSASDGDVAGPGDVDDEDGWSEVEA